MCWHILRWFCRKNVLLKLLQQLDYVGAPRESHQLPMVRLDSGYQRPERRTNLVILRHSLPIINQERLERLRDIEAHLWPFA